MNKSQLTEDSEQFSLDENVLRRLSEVESDLTDSELDVIDNFLREIMYESDGTLRSLDSIEESIFYRREFPEINDLEKAVQKKSKNGFANYLLTKAYQAMDYYTVSSGSLSESGVFPAVKNIRHDTNKLSESFQEIKETQNDSKTWEESGESSSFSNESVSRMDLEALLSDETIGKIYPTCYGEFNYGFSIPVATGFKSPVIDNAKRQHRHTETLSQEDIKPGDVLLELPRSRIMDNVLPVPSNYMVVGSLDEPLTLVDPDNENPFCTFLVNRLESDHLRYVVRYTSDGIHEYNDEYSPTEEEIVNLGAAFPTPEEVDGESMNLFSAKQVVSDYMKTNFIYACDERLGKFLTSNEDELGIKVEGLKVGHCDVLAWAAANYFRQMGFTSFVVNSESTNEQGSAFKKRCGHSRVAIISKSGGIVHFDPTSVCQSIKGYGLSSISDSRMMDLELDFENAKDRIEKIAVLNKFRALIEEKQHVEEHKVRTTEAEYHLDKPSLFDGVFLTDEDIKTLMMDGWCEKKWSEKEITEINNVCDLLASKQLPISMACINRVGYFEYVQDLLNNQGIGPGPQIVFRNNPLLHGGFLSKFFPLVLEYIYDMLRLSNCDIFSDSDPATMSPDFVPNSVISLPAVETVEKIDVDFALSAMNSPMKRGEHSVRDLAKISLFLKLVAISFKDEKVRERFGIDEKELAEYAIKFEKALAPDTKPKKVHTDMRTFSGKKTQEDYKTFCTRAEQINSAMAVDEKDSQLASTQFLKLLLKMPLRQESDTRWDRAAKEDYVDYDPNRHHVEQIDYNATLKRGKDTIVLTKVKPKIKQLFIHLDVDSLEEGTNNIISFIGRCKVILQTLIKFARMKNTSVHISSDNNDYFTIDPNKPFNIDVASFRLALPEIGRLSDVYGFQTKKGLPKNVIYLSNNEGKVNAVQSVMRKKTNVIAKTFGEIGLDIFPRMRQKDSLQAGKTRKAA
jgi:hypothetical protein